MLIRRSFHGVGLLVLSTLVASALVMGGCATDPQNEGAGGSSAPNGATTGGGSAGEGGAGGSAGEGGANGEPTATSIALLNAQITQLSSEQKSGWLDTGETLDPTTLIVVISTESQTCDAPVFTLGTGASHHRLVLIGLPQSIQQIGTYELSTTDVIAFGKTWLSDGMGNGGGGEKVLTQGTVEVLSIDATTIEVRLAGLPDEFALDNGEHHVARCP